MALRRVLQKIVRAGAMLGFMAPEVTMTLTPVSWVLLASLATSTRIFAEDRPVAPRGEYAKIDVRLANETIAALQRGSDAERTRAIKAIETAPQKYAPPVFYVLSNTLFSDGRKDDGAFWFYAGQLRARYDANRCADESARQAVSVLNQEFGTPINKYLFEDFAKVEALVPRVVEWDRKTPHEYDHRWINLHGMAAMLESLDPSAGKPEPLSLPRAQWSAIAEKTRVDYVDGLLQGRVIMKERAAAASARAAIPAPPGWERRLLGSWKQELSSMLVNFPKSLPGVEPGEAGRRAAAERFRLKWTVTADTIAITSVMTENAQRRPAKPFRIVKVAGNIATIELTPADEPAFEWDLQYLGPNLMSVLRGSNEIYRLERVTKAAKSRSR